VSRSALGKLKNIRVVTALLFFIPTSLIFLDPWHFIPTGLSDILTSFQIIPAVLRITTFLALNVVALTVVIGLTAVFGRVYCSTICPLGIFQDIVIRIQKKLHRRKRFEYKKPPFLFHYSLFIVTTILVLEGSVILLNLFEPFSNYGRVLTNFIQPVITVLNNITAGILNGFGFYSLYNIPLRAIHPEIYIVPFLFLAIVTYLSYRHGRLFCNSLCPAGALLGIISRISFYKIAIDENACNNCGACEKVCKAGCIESETKQIDFSACVGCFNCIHACPTSGVVYARYQSGSSTLKPVSFDASRRTFFKSITIPAIGLVTPAGGNSDTTAAKPLGYFASKKIPVTPPGAKSIKHFTDYCTACHLCVSACPAQVLYPTFLEYGMTGIFQPKMNYDASYCNYDCTICGEVCPSGAILPVDIDTKKLIQIGKAVFVRDDCVVVKNKKDCAACSEHCPTKAVHSIPYEGKLKIPELNNDICVGCGACEHACPTTPRKAIYVVSNPVHLHAQKPKVIKQEGGFDSKQDFPF
jgi:ferredoxin